MSEAETKTIVGACSEVAEKNGWTAFSIDVPGNNYPIRLSTKLPALIEQARAVGQDIATWTYKESQGGENPNKPGTFYTNRYLEKAEVGATTVDGNATPSEGISMQQAAESVQRIATAAMAPASSQTTEGMTPEKWDAKERRDYRSRAWAQTLGAFTHTISVNDKPEDVFKRLQPFQRAVFTDVCQSFAYPVVDEDENLPFG